MISIFTFFSVYDYTQTEVPDLPVKKVLWFFVISGA